VTFLDAHTLVDVNPDTATPIAVSVTGLSPAIVLTRAPLPVVVVNAQSQLRLVDRPSFDTPAVTLIVADDCR